MKEELNYLSEKIDIIEGKLDILKVNKSKYTSCIELNYYRNTVYQKTKELRLLNNMLSKLTEIEPTKTN